MAVIVRSQGEFQQLGLRTRPYARGLMANLQSGGRRTDRSLLVILAGSKALRKAVRATFGDAALVQRCQVHKMRKMLE